MPSGEQSLADGARALPLVVLVVLLLDVISTLVAQAYGVSGLGPSGLLPAGQSFLIAVASAATMYNRRRSAVVLSAVVVALVFTVGPTGSELWLLIIVGVTVAARATPGQVGLVLVGQIAYVAGFGLLAEHRRAGWGWFTGLTGLGFVAAALVVGLVGRRLLHARDRRRSRVRELEREQTEIRAVERARLADELQVVATQGLAEIDRELAGAARSPDAGELRAVLVRVDQHSRALLTQLRALLDVLRQVPVAVGEPGYSRQPPAQRWLELVGARHVRLAATAVTVLVAARAAAGIVVAPADGAVWVQVVGLLACATILWRPVAGAGLAAAALVITTALDPRGYWDALSTTLLCLAATFRYGPRRVAFVALALVAYSGLLAATDATDSRSHIVLVCYLGFLGVVIGLTARHFVAARDHSLRQLVDLGHERDRVESEERNAVARELHDVVAHSLSVITMQVMATSLADDRRTLSDTLDKVRRSAQAAHRELGILLGGMREPGSSHLEPTPLVTPTESAQTLGRRLAENGYRPTLDIDPAADALDPTTQRTLGRIMQEAATNILRYTPAGSPCSFTLQLDGSGVGLRIASPLATSARSSDLSLGWGLRGTRERVELTSGSFSAGPQRDQWLLDVRLPASVEPPPPDSTVPEPGPAAALPGVVG